MVYPNLFGFNLANRISCKWLIINKRVKFVDCLLNLD